MSDFNLLLSWSHYTRHRLHLNQIGKKLLCEVVVGCVKTTYKAPVDILNLTQESFITVDETGEVDYFIMEMQPVTMEA